MVLQRGGEPAQNFIRAEWIVLKPRLEIPLHIPLMEPNRMTVKVSFALGKCCSLGWTSAIGPFGLVPCYETDFGSVS